MTATTYPTKITTDTRRATSPGLWTLAWRRLRSDRVGMVALSIVIAFLVMMLLSATGLIASDWSREVGVNYAPPSWWSGSQVGSQLGTNTGADTSISITGRRENMAGAAPPQDTAGVVDPLGEALREIRGEQRDPVSANLQTGVTGAHHGPEDPEAVHDPLAPAIESTGAERSASSAGKERSASDRAEGAGVTDPLADVMADINRDSNPRNATSTQRGVRAATLPMGGDKWGRDVLKKVIKGSETSIFVGLASAVIAVILGTVFGALAGYVGGWVDDAFNWFYNVFTSIPYLLLILAVAAVLQQKGTLTIILILGLTGWTGVFRLVRGEYLKHKHREYVLAADAVGASNTSRMFFHIFPNMSHVVLVQLSILTVAFIKSEVILSFLGFGVPVDVVSWGSMLNEAQNELILGKWWQLAAAGAFMAVLVTAFSLFTDALRDALDPKLK